MSQAEHKAKMTLCFHNFKVDGHKVKRKRSNKNHAHEMCHRGNRQHNIQEQQDELKDLQELSLQHNVMDTHQQANEYDLLLLLHTQLSNSGAFVPSLQEPITSDTFINGHQNVTNQAVPPSNLSLSLDYNPQMISMVPPPISQTSPTQILQPPSNHTIVPIMNDISALSIHDPILNSFPAAVNYFGAEPTISTANTTIKEATLKQKQNEIFSRPHPPILKDGPIYVRPSEDFIEYFDEIDDDDSGTISFSELKGSLFNKGQHSHQNFNDQAIWTLIEMFDKNSDGVIDKEEFPELFAYIRNWEACFLFLDKDKSGTINYKEMHMAIQGLGLRDFLCSCLSTLLHQYDPTGNEEIDFDNFILVCVSVVRFNDTFKFMQKTFGPHGIGKLTLEDLIVSCGKQMYNARQ